MQVEHAQNLVESTQRSFEELLKEAEQRQQQEWSQKIQT